MQKVNKKPMKRKNLTVGGQSGYIKAFNPLVFKSYQNYTFYNEKKMFFYKNHASNDCERFFIPIEPLGAKLPKTRGSVAFAEQWVQ
jgi:hypothetical protein